MSDTFITCRMSDTSLIIKVRSYSSFTSCTTKMWRLLIATVVLVNLGEGQRSFYAPRPGSYPKLLPRFRKNETAFVSNTYLETRDGEQLGSGLPGSSVLPLELQGTLDNERFVQRVSQWPKDRQPFWFKNRYVISSMRNRDIDGGSVGEQFSGGNQQPIVEFQTPFLGPSRVKSSN